MMEGIDDKEMNEFVKKNPEYAEDFYRQMKDRYSMKIQRDINNYPVESVGIVFLDTNEIEDKGVWPKDPLKFS